MGLITGKNKIQKIIKVKDLGDLRDIIKERYKENNKEIDLRDLDVSEVNDFTLMTEFAPLVEIIDITNWKVSGTYSLNHMFYNKQFLTEIKGIEDLDISHIKDISFMFAHCNLLKRLDLSKWNISNIINAIGSFKNCYNLIDLKGVDNDKWKNIRSKQALFSGCKQKIMPDWYPVF